MNPYEKGKKSKITSTFTSSFGGSRDIDLRKELTAIFDDELRSTYFLYRRVRRDEDGRPIRHPYTKTNRSGEGPKDVGAEHSTSTGYLYDDYIVKGYMNHSQAYSITKRIKATGESHVDYRTTYFEYDALSSVLEDRFAIPTVHDRILRLKQDIEGELKSPTEIEEKYDILSVDPYRLDKNGRIEYYRIRVISVADDSYIV